MIKIYTFGTLRVVRNDYQVTEGDWHTRQARQLLKILVTERPRPVSTDRLIEILWPNSTPDAAATTLRSAVNALRNVFEPDRRNRAPSRYIVTQAPGYAFRPEAEVWLDVEEFQAEIAAAQRLALRDDAEAASRRLAHLMAATALYEDDYLVSDPYADWAQAERERLQELYFNALLDLADLHAQAGAYPAAIAACRQVLARNEVRENAYQALMRYQALSGDSAGALVTYERCRSVLAEELGADPSPVTQELHGQILNGEIRPVIRPSGALPASASTSQTIGGSLPAAKKITLPERVLLPTFDSRFAPQIAPIFVGRENEVALLERLLLESLAGKGQFAILEGEAGAGKTRLAVDILSKGGASGATVLSVTCQAIEHSLPFAPLADLLGRYLHSLSEATVRSLPSASLALLAYVVPGAQDLVPDLPAAFGDLSLGADENRYRLIDAFVSVFAMLANLRPLVLFFDDLHWADAETLAVISRISQRITDLPLFILLAYRTDDIAENEPLARLLHATRRTARGYTVAVGPLTQQHVHKLVEHTVAQAQVPTGPAHSDDIAAYALAQSGQLAAMLHAATQGNALFVTEALRDLIERQASLHDAARREPDAAEGMILPALRRNQRVQEVIRERIERLPSAARAVLRLTAVIGRDFSVDLLEAASDQDPMAGLNELLSRKFLVERTGERTGERIDFIHQVTRQVAYDMLNALERRRCHLHVAKALEALGRAEENPREAAFHFGLAGQGAQQAFARYSVLAGERLLRTFGFRQALAHFDDGLAVLHAKPDEAPEWIERGLLGRAVAYESLLDPEGVSEAYRRLQTWATSQGNRGLILAIHSRQTTMLTLLGRQQQSNQLLHELLQTLASTDGGAPRSRVLADLLARRRVIFGVDAPVDAPAPGANHDAAMDDRDWPLYVIPPEPVANPAHDLSSALEPAYTVLPLIDYGWTLLVQSQLRGAVEALEGAVRLAHETGQRAIATVAYHQLALAARIQGDDEASRRYNDLSIATNREVSGVAAELLSLWPRISSAFLALEEGRLDEAERRLQRVVDFLQNRNAFHNYRTSANIGLGLVALARGERRQAEHTLEKAIADPVNLYPYTHVRALLGLARIRLFDGDPAGARGLHKQALRFAGQRSLLDEYVETLLEIARLVPDTELPQRNVSDVLAYAEAMGARRLADALRDLLPAAPLVTLNQ